ncbi:MAG TPA: aldo/keto reductase [Abditibacteriaceae bacterium]|nr:aldo/keto reductase [Abditibacteriaceae bacterium]
MFTPTAPAKKLLGAPCVISHREDVVIATKVHGQMRPGANGQGLSRKAIFQQIDASLKRLGTDYVDFYQTHRWDSSTPIEETLKA